MRLVPFRWGNYKWFTMQKHREWTEGNGFNWWISKNVCNICLRNRFVSRNIRDYIRDFLLCNLFSGRRLTLFSKTSIIFFSYVYCAFSWEKQQSAKVSHHVVHEFEFRTLLLDCMVIILRGRCQLCVLATNLESDGFLPF